MISFQRKASGMRRQVSGKNQPHTGVQAQLILMFTKAMHDPSLQSTMDSISLAFIITHSRNLMWGTACPGYLSHDCRKPTSRHPIGSID